MSMMSGRKRPCLILVQTYTEVDGQYAPVKTWAEDRQVWVNIEPKRGIERHNSNETESIVTHVIRGDYYDLVGITPQMRVIYHPEMSYSGSPSVIDDASKVYQILAVIEDDNEHGDVMIQVEEEGRNYGQITG